MIAERNIQRTLRGLMKRRGLVYRDVAESMGCSAQNVWNRLNNKAISPEFRVARGVLMAMGFDFYFYSQDWDLELDLRREAIIKAAEDSRLMYCAVFDLMMALGVQITIKPIMPESEKVPIEAEGGAGA